MLISDLARFKEMLTLCRLPCHFS